jgi:hypothetical protein
MTVIVLVFVLGAIVMSAGRSAPTPAEAPVMDATLFVAPFEATAMSPDGHVGDVTPPTAAAETTVVGQPAFAQSRSP